jgi:nitrite reductase/ring-hydroxylating ferredoxin subunit
VTEDDNFVAALDEAALENGKMVPQRINGVPVLFIKQNGKIYVIDDRCPHMGCKFSGGSLDGDVVVCPCHDWRFNLESGEYEEMPDYKLVTYPFKVKDSKIWVNLEEEDF